MSWHRLIENQISAKEIDRMSKSGKILGTAVVALTALVFVPWLLNLIKISNRVEFGYTIFKIEELFPPFVLAFMLTALVSCHVLRLITWKNTTPILLATLLCWSFVEEIVFRAPLIVNITEPSFMIGFQVVLASSVVFALLHWSLDEVGITRVIFAFVWGVIFGIAALVSRSIWLCVVMHCAVNALMVVLRNVARDRAQINEQQPATNKA